MSMNSALKSAAVLALGVLALTACQSGGTAASAAPTGSSAASSGSSGSGVAPVSAPSTGAAGGSGSGSSVGSSAGTGSAPGSGSAAGSGSGSGDAYAYTHPCTPQQLSVRVTRRAAAPSQRVIAVRNLGSRSCGLSYFPLVSLDDSRSGDRSQAVKPLIPSGLGGAPAYPVQPGQTAYAVVDLDPSGATTGTVAGVDELNVLSDGDHMPNAATLNFPLGSGASVLKPKLGLYRSTVSDAVSSMQTADTQS